MDPRLWIFVGIVVLFVGLVWRLRAPRQPDDPDADAAALQREQDRALSDMADVSDSARLRRYRTGNESRKPPRR